jgi:hypothetical protein
MPKRRTKSAAGLLAEVERLGREGASRREIAVALGVTLPGLAVHAAANPELARALAAADEAARSWWEGLPRAAMEAGARIDMASWRGAMAGRYGEAALLAPTPPEPRRTAIYELPDNGTNRRYFPERKQPRDREEAEHYVGLWELAVERAHHGLKLAKRYLGAFPPGEDDEDDDNDLVEDDPGDDVGADDEEADEWA